MSILWNSFFKVECKCQVRWVLPCLVFLQIIEPKVSISVVTQTLHWDAMLRLAHLPDLGELYQSTIRQNTKVNVAELRCSPTSMANK